MSIGLVTYGAPYIEVDEDSDQSHNAPATRCNQIHQKIYNYFQEVASRYGTVLRDRFGSCGAFALRTCGTVGKKSEKPEEDRASLSQIVALPQSIHERPGSSDWRVANKMNVIFSSNTACGSHKVNLSRETTVLSGHITKIPNSDPRPPDFIARAFFIIDLPQMQKIRSSNHPFRTVSNGVDKDWNAIDLDGLRQKVAALQQKNIESTITLGDQVIEEGVGNCGEMSAAWVSLAAKIKKLYLPWYRVIIRGGDHSVVLIHCKSLLSVGDVLNRDTFGAHSIFVDPWAGSIVPAADEQYWPYDYKGKVTCMMDDGHLVPLPIVAPLELGQQYVVVDCYYNYRQTDF